MKNSALKTFLIGLGVTAAVVVVGAMLLNGGGGPLLVKVAVFGTIRTIIGAFRNR